MTEAADDAPASHPLVGGWRLRTWVSIADDGSETRPMGDAPDGLVVYTAGGTISSLAAHLKMRLMQPTRWFTVVRHSPVSIMVCRTAFSASGPN